MVRVILRHPFQLAGNSAATVDQDTPEGLAQGVALLVSTRKGERQMQPAYGIADPVFSAFSLAEINAALAMYGPDVEVTAIAVDPTSMTEEAVTVGFVSRGV